MSDTTVTTEAATTPTAPPLPNDPAARSATGEILEPSQIQPTAAETAAAKRNQPNGEAPAETSTPKDGDKPAAPDAYAAFTAPDGYTLDPKAIEAFTPIAKELGLTQDQAQKLVDFHSQAMIAAAKAPTNEYEATRTAWKAQVEADPQIKGAVLDGKTGLDAVKIGIGKTLAAIGDPQLTQDFKAAMDLTGAGDNPAFIKAMWKLSAFVTEGKHVQGAQPSVHGQTAPGTSARPDAAHALYPGLR